MSHVRHPGPRAPVLRGLRSRRCLLRLSEAVADIEAAFAGAYDELWHEASLVAVARGGQAVAAVEFVRRPPWKDIPDGPFVIELFTSRKHRGLGLTRTLMQGVVAVVAGAGEKSLALRVDDQNVPALSLHRSLGFREWLAAS